MPVAKDRKTKCLGGTPITQKFVGSYIKNGFLSGFNHLKVECGHRMMDHASVVLTSTICLLI